MSEKKNIKLEKEVTSNIAASKLYDSTFNRLAKPKEFIDIEKIKNIYDDSIYNIPLTGKNSHQSIVKESTQFLYPQRERQLEDIIEINVGKLGGLTQELSKATLPPPDNVVYPNGTMLQAGEAGQKFSGGKWNTVWVMDRGLKRAFTSEKEYFEVRKALQIPGDDWSEIVFLSLPELNSIPDGKNITTGQDLSIPLSELNADYGKLYFETPHSRLLLKCEGVEVPDSYNLITSNYYVDDTQGCIIKYILDEYLGDPIADRVETIELNAGETVELKVLKHEGIPDRWINVPALYEYYYDGYNRGNPGIEPTSWDEEILEGVIKAGVGDYTLDNQPRRKWGRDREYKGIVFASGRIDILEINGKIIGDNAQWLLNAVDTTQNIPSSISFDERFGPDNLLKIYNQCIQLDGSNVEMCYGRLNQDNSNPLVNDLFNSPDSYYYLQGHAMIRPSYDPINNQSTFYNPYNLTSDDEIYNINGYPFYGQPVLKGSQGNHFIVLDIDSSKGVWFFNLTLKKPVLLSFPIATQKFMMVKEGVTNPNLWFEDWEPISIGYNHFNWEKVNSARLSYVGLLGTRPNKSLLPYNYWNVKSSPRGAALGSNYYLTSDTQQKIDANLQVEHTYNGSCEFTEGQLMDDFININTLPEGCHFGNCIDC